MWDKLAAAGLLASHHANGRPPETTLHSPWYIRLMLGFAGWIAAFFLLGFVAVGLGWVVKSATASMLAGLFMMGGTWWVFHKGTDNDFLEQFALAFSFAGQGLFANAVFNLLEPDFREASFWLSMSLLQAILALLMNNPIHRGWSAFAATASLYLALNNITLEPLLSGLVLALGALIWLNEVRRSDLAALLRPLGYGVVAGLVLMDLATGLFRGSLGFSSGTATAPQWAWLGQLLSGAVLIWVVADLLRREGLAIKERKGLIILGGAILLVLISLKAPGIAIGICIMLLGFAHGNILLCGFGILALLLYAGGYYYRLDATLLEKAISLSITGLTLLLIRWGFMRHV
jgi:hypothetical protein